MKIKENYNVKLKNRKGKIILKENIEAKGSLHAASLMSLNIKDFKKKYCYKGFLFDVKKKRKPVQKKKI